VEDELKRLGLETDPRGVLLRSLGAAYRDLGLLDAQGETVRLSACCPRQSVCWAADRRERAPGDPSLDAVALPWIGADYADDRILVVGTNFNSWGGLGSHWDTCRSHIDAMRAGGPGKNGGLYSARAMSAVRAVRDGRAGHLVEGWQPPPNADLADEWQSVAYLQGVKCAPTTVRSKPFDDMYVECPSLTLMTELRILRPSVVIVFGRSRLRNGIRPVLEREADMTYGSSPGSMERDTFRLGPDRCELICLNHPSAQNSNDWRKSLSELIDDLSHLPPPRVT